jgi:MFS family permease
MADTTPDPNGTGPNGAASNSPGQGCEADAALGFLAKNAPCPEWAASQNLKLVTPDPQPFHWQALAGICLGVLMFTLDGSIVNIAIPTFLREFHTTLIQAKWIVLAYLIVIVVFLLPVGRAAVFAGRKNIFLGGLGLFTAGSLLCGSAWDLRSLVAFRVVQGAGAVGMAALMSSLVLANAPRGKVGQSLGMITTFATLGTSLGPTIGGFLITWFGWRSLFFVNLPVGLAAVYLVGRFVRPDPPAEGGFRLRALLPDFSLFSNRVFSNGIFGRFVTMAVNGGYLFLAPILLENALHFSTVKAGLLLATTPVIGGITAPFFGALSDRFGVARFNLAGLAFMFGAVFFMGGFFVGMTGGGFILRVCLWGLGLGVFNAPNTVCIMKSVSQRETGAASALLSLSIMLGQAVGVAGMAAMFHHQSGAAEGGVLALPPAAIVSGVSTTLLAAMIPLGLVLLLNALSAPAISRACRLADQTSDRVRG